MDASCRPYGLELIAIRIEDRAPAIEHGIHDGQVALIAAETKRLPPVPYDLSVGCEYPPSMQVTDEYPRMGALAKARNALFRRAESPKIFEPLRIEVWIDMLEAAPFQLHPRTQP